MFVYRLILADSVEDQLFKFQRMKDSLFRQVIDQKQDVRELELATHFTQVDTQSFPWSGTEESRKALAESDELLAMLLRDCSTTIHDMFDFEECFPKMIQKEKQVTVTEQVTKDQEFTLLSHQTNDQDPVLRSPEKEAPTTEESLAPSTTENQEEESLILKKPKKTLVLVTTPPITETDPLISQPNPIPSDPVPAAVITTTTTKKKRKKKKKSNPKQEPVHHGSNDPLEQSMPFNQPKPQTTFSATEAIVTFSPDSPATKKTLAARTVSVTQNKEKQAVIHLDLEDDESVGGTPPETASQKPLRFFNTPVHRPIPTMIDLCSDDDT